MGERDPVRGGDFGWLESEGGWVGRDVDEHL